MVIGDVKHNVTATEVAGESQAICAIIAGVLGVPCERLSIETSLVDELGADSIDVIELVTQLEEEFDIRVGDRAVVDIKTVGDTIELVQSLRDR
jgi:acyl carrier protein